MSMVHASRGKLLPASTHLRSEPAIIAGMAQATLPHSRVPWAHLIEDYDRIRDLIEKIYPDFRDYNARIRKPGGFRLPLPPTERIWKTPSGKAEFIPFAGLREDPDIVEGNILRLTTLRSHDQYNTTIYGLDDRYRGVFGMRHVVFVSAEDIQGLGFQPGDKVDLVSLWDDGRERRAPGFTLVAYDIPKGQAAAYYPETNPLVPLDSYGDRRFEEGVQATDAKWEEAAAKLKEQAAQSATRADDAAANRLENFVADHKADAAAVEEATSGLIAKRDELLGKIKKLQQGQQIDPADLAAVEAERDELKGKLTEANKALTKATKAAEDATKRATDIDAAYSRSLSDAALTEALTKAGVPGLGVHTDLSKYFDYHHTAADTLDKVDAVDLAKNVAVVAVAAFVIADMPARLDDPIEDGE